MISAPISFLKSAARSVKQFSKEGTIARAIVLGPSEVARWSRIVAEEALAADKEKLKATGPKDITLITSARGPLWLVFRPKPKGPFSHHGHLEDSEYAWFREQGGSLWSLLKTSGQKNLEIEFHKVPHEAQVALFAGMELASYSFKEAPQGYQILHQIKSEIVDEGRVLGEAVNIARHMVNQPPNLGNPSTFAEFAKAHFKEKGPLALEVWNTQRLAKEGMGLHIAVGQGSAHGPCMLHFRYRPKKAKGAPVAFVGKGVTFDTGGLDIKPSAGMRLMKKDMGGAAALMGFAHWLREAEPAVAVDLYLGFAENAVDANSMRPSDIFQSRNGLKVEIHNTDAEGRLVLADCLDVAVTQKGKDEPALVVDLATLTGAIKTALGTEIAGLFSNHDPLATQLSRAGQRAGELNWRMPLFSRYASNFSSPFADLVNAVDGWAGAITAALFLEKFVRQKPWAHLDIYAWNDKPSGCLTFAGGNGQGVQTLIHWIKDYTGSK